MEDDLNSNTLSDTPHEKEKSLNPAGETANKILSNVNKIQESNYFQKNEEKINFHLNEEKTVSLCDVTTEADLIASPLSKYRRIDSNPNEKTFQTGFETPPDSYSNQSDFYHNRNFNRNRPSTATSNFYRNKRSQPTEEDLSHALTLMIKRRMLPDPSIRPKVINYAKKLGSRKMLDEEYDEAKQIDLAVDIMFTSIQQDKEQEDIRKQNEVIQKRLEIVIQKRKEIDEKFNAMISEENQYFEEKVEELKEKHFSEIDNFKSVWARPEAIIPFNKPSPQIFQLRKQQKSMALIRDFTNAKVLKKQADNLERKEASQAIKRAEETMKAEYKQLMDRQDREISCLKDNHQKNIANLELNKEKELKAIKNTEQQLKEKLELTKSMRKPKVMVPILKQKENPNTTGIITYRTRTQVNKFRNKSETGRLPVKMIDVNRTVNTMTPKSRRRKAIQSPQNVT
ncbi:hypothetical protein TRFO_13997 [Tritrichomonas foetus]|uniref:Uncharacterized protein n=1 Tax=Tritrichomonas foetus TaxID=1144522 RepID=A0A1J4KWM1_9EUKA|nr:hypothetical protein TRFO_13997 [Tritrichomonas foetus]|eukprot:OHT15631.1 hypothetical protein TRFO_13997 [Tritrichomonas foetus]